MVLDRYEVSHSADQEGGQQGCLIVYSSITRATTTLGVRVASGDVSLFEPRNQSKADS